MTEKNKNKNKDKNKTGSEKPIFPVEEINNEQIVQAGTILSLQQEYAQQTIIINNLRQTVGRQAYQIKRLEDSQVIIGANVQGTMSDIQFIIQSLKDKGLI